MKLVFAILASVLLAGFALAADPVDDQSVSNGVTPYNPQLDRGLFHVQEPTASYYTTNASTAFGSEIVDDIPANLDGEYIGQIVVYIGEWGGSGWVPPNGIYVNFYHGECPPDMDPYDTLYFVWDNPDQMEYEFVNDTGTAFDLRVTLFLGNLVQIQAPMSIGFAVDNDWGTEAPYCGVDYCDLVYGCGAGYYDHTYWGEPRWTQYHDVAYSLDNEGVIAVENSTWDAVKVLYR